MLIKYGYLQNTWVMILGHVHRIVMFIVIICVNHAISNIGYVHEQLKQLVTTSKTKYMCKLASGNWVGLPQHFLLKSPLYLPNILVDMKHRLGSPYGNFVKWAS